MVAEQQVITLPPAAARLDGSAASFADMGDAPTALSPAVI
jgi:hypothetical protein